MPSLSWLFFISMSETKYTKRPMGHIAHPIKSVNTFEQSYDHIYNKTGPVVQEEKIFKFHENTFAMLLLSPNVKRCGLSIWKKLKSSLPKDSFCLVWLKLARWLYRNRFLIFFNVLSLFRSYRPVEIGGALHWII